MPLSFAFEITRRRFLTLTAGGALAALAACGKQESAPPSPAPNATKPPAATAETIAIRFGINPWPGAMPFKTAEAQGLFKANGLDMKLTLFSSISQMMEAFNAGQIDATLIDPGTLLVSAANGIAQKFVFVTDFSNGADAVVVAPSIKSLADLKGQSISVEMGSIGHFLLLTGLKQAGLSTKDVKLVNQTADLALAAFAAGKTKVAVSYEPFITQVTKSGKGHVIFSTREAPIAPDVLSMRQDFLDRNPEGPVRLVRAWYQALDWRRQHMDEAIAIEAKALEVTPDDFRAFGDGVRLLSDPREVAALMVTGESPDRTLEKITAEVDAFMRDQKLLEKDPPPAAQLIDATFVNRYLAGIGGGSA